MAALTPALADDAIRSFLAVLTVLLLASLIEIMRQPLAIAGSDARDVIGDMTPGPGYRPPAQAAAPQAGYGPAVPPQGPYPPQSWAQDPYAQPPAPQNPYAQPPAPENRYAPPVPPHGRHAAPAAMPAVAPLPIRGPGQAARIAAVSATPSDQADRQGVTRQPRPSGGPPWGPAPWPVSQARHSRPAPPEGPGSQLPARPP